jgi:hypothetical protein
MSARGRGGSRGWRDAAAAVRWIWSTESLVTSDASELVIEVRIADSHEGPQWVALGFPTCGRLSKADEELGNVFQHHGLRSRSMTRITSVDPRRTSRDGWLGG